MCSRSGAERDPAATGRREEDPVSVQIDVEAMTVRAEAIAGRELDRLVERTPASARLYERAVRSMPLGVASTFQAADPYPIYLERGQGSQVWDVDGNEYRDFHSGFGVNVGGHAPPPIVGALKEAAPAGTHIALSAPGPGGPGGGGWRR